jgi:hypothetical protein
LARHRTFARERGRGRDLEFIERAPILIISVGQLHHPLISRTYVADLDRGFPYMMTRPAVASPWLAKRSALDLLVWTGKGNSCAENGTPGRHSAFAGNRQRFASGLQPPSHAGWHALSLYEGRGEQRRIAK